jgi:hypothetical protein
MGKTGRQEIEDRKKMHTGRATGKFHLLYSVSCLLDSWIPVRGKAAALR